MREVELKSVVDDVLSRRAQVETAGGKLVYAGRLLDRRYDYPDRSLTIRDHVLRVRVYESGAVQKAMLDWKGETRYEHGFKVREEVSTPVEDADALTKILEMLGFVVTSKSIGRSPSTSLEMLSSDSRNILRWTHSLKSKELRKQSNRRYP
jgi:predicted adenylyl cyclase CyaB